MTTQVRSRRAGRPSKGERHVMTARVPVATAEIVFRLAEARGIPASEFIAEAVQEKLARTDLSFVETQQELPLQKSA
ncbi:ribbon-helix-helix protein, CopG family [Citricoccus sp. SGAir0253]|uniref:ribbon-helix-helix protein, CopG family n=1 Tax=Citricoccus sp. SGAir0253 TaxID=2567881 RepID=UPI00143D42CA|nr:ribbon-helix-helix protein, CopG family [Citricoccus sp. SGAir0253]